MISEGWNKFSSFLKKKNIYFIYIHTHTHNIHTHTELCKSLTQCKERFKAVYVISALLHITKEHFSVRTYEN